ncbi:hypothetical protein [Leptothrix discophora]|uniref:ATPase with chaperone activity n=1 Tax=Leptothrix discophora TaxID=89 RepID=A0ABT9G5H9_LEPDI|nr:hypothetical protein [Leptothrix discophora]MDP4301739.1 hypothetical protein [Leptothrix discophora]
MSDDCQIEVPPSFTALHVDARSRLRIPLAELRQRYEWCEDMAQQLVERAQQVHHDLGVAQDQVIARIGAGLADPASQVDAAEAGWVLRRLAELLGWDWDEVAPPPDASDPQRPA